VSWDRIRRVIVVTVAVLSAAPAAAQAVVTVNTNGDPAGAGCAGGTCSLRQAIAAAASGDTINFDPSLNGQTITLTGGVLSITQSVTIAGPGADTLTIDGNGDTTVFDVAPSLANQNVTISGLTITGGSATTDGGGIIANDVLGSLTLDGDTITNNQVSIADPTNQTGGGGVYVNGGDLIVNNSSIIQNTVTLTGAGSSHSGGGAIFDNGGNITIAGSNVSDNTVDQSASTGFSGGGGIYSNGGDVEITGTTVNDNTHSIGAGSGGFDGGGGIYSNGGVVDLETSGVGGNTFGLTSTTSGHNGGGAVYSNGGEVTAVSSSVDANTLNLTDTSTVGRDGGGAVYSNGANVGVAYSSISQNSGDVTAGGDINGGGAIFDDATGDILITSTVSENTFTLSGAGAANSGGGAVHSSGGGLISNATIAGNSINGPGGALFLDSSNGLFELKNTIVADNTAGSAQNCAGAGTFDSAGFNLESKNGCGLGTTGDLSNTEPKLGPLQNNGGSTSTQALSAGSPAVDAGACTDILGNPLIIDQRGIARPQPAGGKCDIGAFELVQSRSGGSNPPPPPPPPSAPAAVPGAPAATGATGASFSGSVNPNGQATTASFQYGLDSRYRPGGGTAVIYDQSTTPQALPADSAVHAVSASASGLVPNAVYHVRLVATNATGTTFGPDQTFTTPAGPAPPPPVLGQSVNAKPVSGHVFILVGTKLIPLTEAQKISSGAILDTRTGSLQLTAAPAKGHKPETGTFGGAIFKLTQARNGLTNLALAEGAFQGAPTFATCKAHKAGEASAAASKTLQLLHASAKGKFRTTGRYSAATVRGTKWTIADRCDGTLTHDITHSVAVTDFVRHKTIVLHAGQSYLAKAAGRK
jgi:hypothetical protein